MSFSQGQQVTWNHAYPKGSRYYTPYRATVIGTTKKGRVVIEVKYLWGETIKRYVLPTSLVTGWNI